MREQLAMLSWIENGAGYLDDWQCKLSAWVRDSPQRY